MKKLAILTLGAGLGLALPAAVAAQVGSITAQATVNSVFSAGATQDVTFDAVAPGNSVTVDPVTGTGGTPGYVEFTYNANYRITPTILPTTLTGGGSSTVDVAWVCGTSPSTATPPGGAGSCTQGTAVTADNSVAGPGTTVVWLGGTVSNTDVLAGTYTGNITFTIAAF
ncbi:MAG: hypothetical protein P8177_01685 [Gemmatimonadota bacterium]|jgi:hypothetical protein